MAITRKQVGQRLRETREAIGFTQSQVAERLDLHRPTVSEIEAGRRAVTTEELYAFADLYATSISAILAEPRPTTEAAVEVLFRRQGFQQPTTKIVVKKFVERCRAEREIEKMLGLPPRPDTRPSWNASIPETKWEAIQQGTGIAEQERRRLELGTEPVRGILALLERQGVTIGQVEPLDDDNLDGFYLETDELGPCIAVNTHKEDDWTGHRAVFTAAHEYAHWLLRDRQVEFFAFSPRTDDLIEVRANAFAAAFLIPAEGLTKYFDSVGLLQERRLTHLSPGDVVRAMDHFGVSKPALLYRLLNLKFIDQPTVEALKDFPVGATASALGIQFGHRAYASTRLPMLAVHAWRKGLISGGRAADLCGVDLDDYKIFVQGIGEEPEVPPGTPLLGAAAVG